MSALFERIDYNQTHIFYVEVCTAVLWIFEFLAIVITEKVIKKRAKKKAIAAKEQAEYSTEAVESAGAGAVAEESEKDSAEKKKPRSVSKPLPLKNVGILTAICLVCVLVISAQIGFKVKPFYDIGEKITSGYDLLNKLGVLITNIVKCLWILMFVKAGVAISEEMFSFMKDGKGKQWTIGLIATAFVMAFGVYDVIASANPFAITYLAFYALFTLLYYLTNKSAVKTCLLILFIYIF